MEYDFHTLPHTLTRTQTYRRFSHASKQSEGRGIKEDQEDEKEEEGEEEEGGEDVSRENPIWDMVSIISPCNSKSNQELVAYCHELRNRLVAAVSVFGRVIGVIGVIGDVVLDGDGFVGSVFLLL